MTDVNRAPFVAPVSAPGAHRMLGGDPGQARISPTNAAIGPKRPIVATESVIPELDEQTAKPRPLWKHPAFIVSIIATVLALAAAAVLLVLPLFLDAPARVATLDLSVGEGNAHLVWTGTDEPVDLFVVDGGEATDLSQLVRGGSEAWLPVGTGWFDDASCFVVRPSDAADQAVSLDAAELEAQGGRSACVADAR